MKLEFRAAIAAIEGAIKIHGVDGLKFSLEIDETSAHNLSTDDLRSMRQKNLWVTMEEEEE